jgi:hypothetical protein
MLDSTTGTTGTTTTTTTTTTVFLSFAVGATWEGAVAGCDLCAYRANTGEYTGYLCGTHAWFGA